MDTSDKILLDKAHSWGFLCHLSEQVGWQIQVPEQFQKWYLQQEHDRWVLYVEETPQVSFELFEALNFLERRASLNRRKMS